MAKDFQRSDRVADAIQRILATTIPREMDDPRVGMVNINKVVVTRDMSIAKVYVTFIGEEDATSIEASVDVLNNAAGFLRGFVSKEVTMRSVPKLMFYFDQAVVRGQHLSSLIDKAIAQDSARIQEQEQ